MRIDADGHLIYANHASNGVLKALRVAVGDVLPTDVVGRFEAVAPSHGYLEFVWDSRTFAVWPVPIRDLNFTNLYGMDVTAERAIVKFPDQNPNPVLRIAWDGVLVYGNPARRYGYVCHCGQRLAKVEQFSDSLVGYCAACEQQITLVAEAAPVAYEL